MRYEDASGAFQASGPIANDDADTLSAGQRGPATGNLITGEGTQYGASGADSAVGAHITAIAGKGGEDTSFSGGKLSVTGEHGRLTVDADGNYSYLANGNVENVRDRFTYTLADNAGNSDTAALIVEIGKTPAVIKANAQQIIPGPDGVVTLPPGVELSDIHVVGRNLVVDLPDGTQLVIIDGAIFVPQLALDGVEIPATNVAALLIGQEIQPAAGEIPPSGGGNFALPPPPLDPGIPLGDLIPPTELNYIPPEPQEVLDQVDRDPEIFIEPDGQPASVAAVDQVEEAGLPSRNGNLPNEPAGSGESADGNGADNDVTSETTAGTILINSPDGVESVTINDVLVTGVVGQTIAGAFGTLTITGFSGDDILYSYTLNDNTSGNDTHDDFSVELTDPDGDVAAATLRIDIIDDVPTARPDIDTLAVGQFVQTGNVMTDAAPGDAGDPDTNAADTVGADNARVTFIDSVNAAPGANVPNGSFVDIAGQHGTLRIFSNGDYTYTRGQNSPGGVQDVFNYTLTDGDGDTSITTLTINIPETPISIQFGNAVALDDDALPGGNPGGPNDDDPDTANTVGDIDAQGGDGALTYSLQTSGAPAGFTYVSGPGGSLLIQQGGVTVITVTLDAATGAYTVTQNAPIDHPSLDGGAEDNTENNLVFPVTVRVTDIDGDFADATGQIIVDDDTPIALEAQVGGTVDEDGVPGGIAGGPDDVGGEATVVNGSVASLFASGADTPLTHSLLSDTSGLPALTSGGVAVTYAVNGNMLTASAGGATVFTFVLNADGSYTFTLVDQLDHPSLDGLPGDDTENDLEIALGSIIQATDADGDSVTAAADGVLIVVDDDTPTAQDIAVNQASEDANVVINIIGSIAGGADGVDLADVTFSAHNGSGSLSYDDNGVFTYDPAPGEEGDVTFSYTIVDGDGDEVTKSVTIHLQPDDVPQVGAPENLEVDEDGFAFANDDASPLQSNPSETDHGENLTDSGQVIVDFGDDVPSAPLANSIVLLDSGALDGQLVDLDGNPVIFAIVGGQLVGSANGVQVMIISISGAVAGPGAGEVTYSYQAQLLQPVQHADVGNTENSDLLSGVQFQVTDSDGDVAGGSFSVTVWDDVPSASDIEVNQPAEDANVVIDITGSIVEGADGVDLADVTFSAHNGSGSLSYNGNGVFTYDPDPGETGDVSFSYTIVDGDGDEVTKQILIHLLDDSVPSAGASTALLDDDGLAGGNPASTTGDIDANVGEVAPTNPSEAIFHGLLNFNFGTDGPGSINFAAMDGVNGTVGTETVVYDWNGATLELTATTVGGTRPGTLLFTLDLDDATSGQYTLTLNDNVLHAAGGNETSAPNVALTFTVLDSDGTDANGTLNITFNDDAPTIDVTEGADAGVVLTTDDLDTIGGASDVVSTSANFGGVFGLTQSVGADGGAAASLSYTLGVSVQGVDSGLDQGGNTIFLYVIGGKVVGSTSATEGGVNAGNTVFDVAVSGTGVVTLTQYSQIDHPIGSDPSATGSPFADHIVSMADGLITLTASATITDNDGDSASDSEVVNIGANLRFTDDGPDVAATLTGTLLKLDETDGVGVPGEVDPVGGNLGTITVNAAVLVNVTSPHVSADTPQTNSYSLVLSADGAASGLLLSSTNAPIFLYNIGGVITGSTSATLAGVNAGNTAFTVSVDSGTGAITMTQFLAVEHGTPGASHDEDSSAINAGVLNLRVTATDFDGDTDSAQVDLGSVIRFEDDGPRFGPDVDPLLEILNDATPSNTGDLDIVVGSDSPVPGNDVISVANFGVEVNGVAATNVSLVAGAEDANTANYTFSFDYPTGTGTTATATGTLVFNKAAGTYTVSLTSGPIEGFSILQTSTGTLFQGYEFGTSTPDGSQPEISVTQIRGTPGDPDPSDLFVQFTSVSEPSSGTGDDNLEVTSWVPGVDNPPPVDGGGDTSWSAGQIFNQDDGWVSTSNTANGVDGDTIQGGEVLDFSLVEGANPTGILAQPDDYGQATTMFLKFDGIGTAEDMIVILKLYDTATDTYTTKAVMIQNADIQKGPGAGPGVFSSITLDNNDGLVIIEANDYQEGNTNLVIVGAQIVGSDEGVTGTAINLNGAIGAGGGSTGTQAFSTDTDNGPFKISSIGFVTESTTNQEAVLDFDVTITDADGDTATQHITVDIGDTQSAMEALPSSKVGSSSLLAANDDGGASSFAYSSSELQKLGFGSIGNTGITSAMVAASGLAMMSTTSLSSFNQPSFDSLVQDGFQSLSAQLTGREGVDEGLASMSFSSGLEGSAVNAVNLSSSGFSFEDYGFGARGLDAISFGDAEPAYVPSYASGEPMVANVPVFAANVPTVSMASAEMLMAANLDGIAQQGGSVEQVLADTIGNHAPTIDAVLANLPGGIAELATIANMASPDAAGVPAWDMGMQGGFAPMPDMVFKVAAVQIHQDAVQPA